MPGDTKTQFIMFTDSQTLHKAQIHYLYKVVLYEIISAIRYLVSDRGHARFLAMKGILEITILHWSDGCSLFKITSNNDVSSTFERLLAFVRLITSSQLYILLDQLLPPG